MKIDELVLKLPCTQILLYERDAFIQILKQNSLPMAKIAKERTVETYNITYNSISRGFSLL